MLPLEGIINTIEYFLFLFFNNMLGAYVIFSSSRGSVLKFSILRGSAGRARGVFAIKAVEYRRSPTFYFNPMQSLKGFLYLDLESSLLFLTLVGFVFSST